MTIKVNNLANFEFWLGIYRPRTKSWQRNHLRDLRKGFVSLSGTSKEESSDKIKALEFLLGKR
jgi:hypothetical protein